MYKRQITVRFVDYPANRIEIQKLDDSGGTLGGAVFTLYPDNAPNGGAPDVGDTTGQGHPTCTTDKLGQCSFEDIGYGSYWVVETGTPPGYETTGVLPAHVILDGAGTPEQPQTVSLVFVNVLIKGTINLQKVDDLGGPVAGAEFTLYPDTSPTGGAPDSDDTSGTGHPVCVTDKQGQCTFPALPLGAYWLMETAVPAGYGAQGALYLHVTVQEGTAPGVGGIVNVTFVNQLMPGMIFVQKRDAAGRGIGGVEYTLYEDEAPTLGSPGNEDTSGGRHPMCVTDKLGGCWFLDVPLGPYWVVETYTPKGVVAAVPSYQPALIGPGPAPGQGDLVMLFF